MPRLGSQARRALRSFDDRHRPPPKAREANFAAVTARIQAGEDSTSASASTPSRRWAIVVAAAAAVIAVVASGLLAARDLASESGPDDRGSLAPASTLHEPSRGELARPPANDQEHSRLAAPTPTGPTVPEPTVAEPASAGPIPAASATTSVGSTPVGPGAVVPGQTTRGGLEIPDGRATSAPSQKDRPRSDTAPQTSAVRDAAASGEHDSAAASNLARESALILGARTALGRDRLDAAARSLREHRMEFPAGALLEEHRAFRAELACRRGDDDARDHVDTFLRKHPASSLRTRVRAACRSVTQEPSTGHAEKID